MAGYPLSLLLIATIGFGIHDVFRTRFSDDSFLAGLSDSSDFEQKHTLLGLFVSVPSFDDAGALIGASCCELLSNESVEQVLASRLDRLSCNFVEPRLLSIGVGYLQTFIGFDNGISDEFAATIGDLTASLIINPKLSIELFDALKS